MKDTTTGEDFLWLFKKLCKHNIKWDKIVKITIDAYPRLTGKQHCIIKKNNRRKINNFLTL